MQPTSLETNLGASGDLIAMAVLQSSGMYPHVMIQSTDSQRRLRGITKPFHDYDAAFDPRSTLFFALHAWFSRPGTAPQTLDFTWLARACELSSGICGIPPEVLFFQALHVQICGHWTARVRTWGYGDRPVFGHAVNMTAISYRHPAGVPVAGLSPRLVDDAQINEWMMTESMSTTWYWNRKSVWTLPPGIHIRVTGTTLEFVPGHKEEL